MKLQTKMIKAVLLTLGLVLALSLPAQAADKAPYKIGLVLELTGPVAFAGIPVRDAAVLEAEWINDHGGINGHPIELDIRDNATEPAKGVTAMQKLALDDKVLAVLGPTAGMVGPAMAPIAEREKLLFIICHPSDKATLAKNYKWVFFLAQKPQLIAEKIVDYMLFKNYNPVISIHNSAMPLWIESAKEVQIIGKSKGLEVIPALDTLHDADTDVTPHLTKIKKIIADRNVKAIFVSSHGANGAVFAKNMQKLGMTTPVIGTHGYGFSSTIELGGSAIEGTVLPSVKLLRPDQIDPKDPQRQVIMDFTQRYKQKYKKDPDQFSSHGYDTMHMLANVIAKVGPDRTKIRDAFENINNFIGVCGVYNYSPNDHEGTTKDSMVMYEIKNGRFNVIMK